MSAIVFGSLPFPGQSGDQLVSKVVTAAIAALFKKTDAIKVNVRAEPVAKLLQGSVDGLDFIGNGMLMYNGLRLEAMELYLQAISIDFSAIFSGQIKLKQPTQATMRIVLTEEDLTTSFNTPFIVEKLQKLQYEGESLNFTKTQIIVNPDKSIKIESEITKGNSDHVFKMDIKTELEVEGRTKIKFTNAEFTGDEDSQALSKAILDHVNNLLNLENFKLDGTRLRVDRARVKDKEFVFYGTAEIDHFPKGKK
jgi:hypothetical protein